MENAVERVQQRAPPTLTTRLKLTLDDLGPSATSRDSHVNGRDRRGPHGRNAVSIGLFALWVGWPGGLALYACGRAARVMRRDV